MTPECSVWAEVLVCLEPRWAFALSEASGADVAGEPGPAVVPSTPSGLRPTPSTLRLLNIKHPLLETSFWYSLLRVRFQELLFKHRVGQK